MNRTMVLAEWRRAWRALCAAEILARESYYEDAVSRAYYATLHAAKAALYIHDVATTSHAAVRRMFGRHLTHSGAIEPMLRRGGTDERRKPGSKACEIPSELRRWRTPMPVVEAVQTFVGIANENEFYSHHYLSEVFKGDIRERLEQWAAAEEAHPEQRAPFKQLASWAGQWFALRNGGTRGGAAAEQLASFQHVQHGLLQALGYAIAPQHLELQAGMPVPVWQGIGDGCKAPQVLVVPAYNPGQEEDDILDQRLAAVHYADVPVPSALDGADFASIVSDGLFGADQAPRFIILVGLHEWLLLDRFKWPNSRALRFDWSEILDRKETLTLQAAAVLLHRDSLAPGSGASLLESLDENPHKHAFGVSEDLKYAIREAIEVLGNEAVRQLRQQAVEARRGFFSGDVSPSNKRTLIPALAAPGYGHILPAAWRLGRSMYWWPRPWA